jgi:hypothetical protein
VNANTQDSTANERALCNESAPTGRPGCRLGGRVPRHPSLGLAMNSPLEPASPASSSSESLTDDITLSQDYSAPAASEKTERSSFISSTFAFAKNVAKRRLPGGSTKTTSNRDSKARRREGNHRKGGQPDRRDNTKAKNDLLDVALFEDVKRSMPLIRWG